MESLIKDIESENKYKNQTEILNHLEHFRTVCKKKKAGQDPKDKV